MQLSELEVQPCPGDVHRVVDVDILQRRVEPEGSKILRAEIDIEILDLGRPVGRESGLQPGADRPTAIVTIRMLLQAGSSVSEMIELSP